MKQRKFDAQTKVYAMALDALEVDAMISDRVVMSRGMAALVLLLDGRLGERASLGQRALQGSVRDLPALLSHGPRRALAAVYLGVGRVDRQGGHAGERGSPAHRAHRSMEHVGSR